MFGTGTARNLPGRIAGLAAALLLLSACGGEPGLTALSIGGGQAYLSVGVPVQLPLTGQFTDGSSRPVTGGVTWFSSDEAVASVDQAGVVTPWGAGAAEITATDQATGVVGRLAVTSRVVTLVRAGTPVDGAAVDRTAAYFRVGGLTAGTMYAARLTAMTDDVDLLLYPDPSLAPASVLCVSDAVGTLDEECLFPADATGEIWLVADGSWTRDGARFALSVAPADPYPLAGVLAFPGDLPFAGRVGKERALYRVDGLAPGATYALSLTGLTADVDLVAWGDPYLYALRCESLALGLADDACAAPADAAGTLYVELDGETSEQGGAFVLDLTPP